MSAAKQELTTPVGRLVQGSLYEANNQDAEGKPLVVKSGPNAGQPRVDYFFALAVPKGGEQHWSQTPWGAKVLAVGQQSYPRGQWQHPSFAWKITDGDSTAPDKKGRAPNSREGFPGHWVLKFSSGFAPKVYQLDPSLKPVLLPQVDAVNLGDWVEVCGTVDGNGSDNQPGIFLNHGMVCLRGYGQRIVVGPDASSAGFGATALPAGVSLTPLAGPGGFPGQQAPQGLPLQMGAPGGFPAQQAAPAAFPGMNGPASLGVGAAPAGFPVQPHPGFLTPQPAPPQLTPAAGNWTYEQLLAHFGNEANMRAAGVLV